MSRAFRCFGMRQFRLGLKAVLLAVILAAALPGPGARAAEGQVGPSYVRMTPVSFSVIGDDNRIDMEVSVFVALELKPDVQEAALAPYTMQLQDAFLVALTQLWDSHPVKGPEISSKDIKNTLMPVVEHVAGPNKVARILILGIGERVRN